ncbi:MAG: DUF5689 domain-containing protein [Bacteroidales bacterium]
MKKIFLLLSLLLTAWTVNAQTYTDLIISEYVEGSSNNKALELYNGTGHDINLADYSLKKQLNGAGDYKAGGNPLTGTLATGKTFLIINAQANAELKAKADNGGGMIDGGNNSVTSFNGDDAIGLFKGAVQIDACGVFNSTEKWGADLTLRRNCSVKAPSATYIPSQWETLPKDDFSDLGKHCAADTKAPTVQSVMPSYTTSLTINFNEKVEKISAEVVANYTINKGITVSTAVLDTSSAKEVVLTISALTKGEAYVLNVNNVKDIALNAMTTASVDTFTYGSTAANTCATIAELRLKPVATSTIYTLENPVAVTALGSQRNQLFIQDATGAILIDDPDHIIATAFAVGDNMTNIQGTLLNYYGLLEFVPTVNATKLDKPTVTITPKVITLTTLMNSTTMADYQCQLIKVNNVKSPTAGIKFANGKNYVLTDGTVTDTLLRTHFYGADYIGSVIPSTPTDFTGIAILNRDRYFITPRNAADMGQASSTEPICATIAELRSRATGTTVYTLNESVVITAIGSQRGQKFIQDETAAILIDDKDSVLSMTFKIGDNIKGLRGKLSSYFGLLQFIPDTTATLVPDGGKIINAKEVTLVQLKDPNVMANYQSQLIQVKGVRFTNTGTFANGKKYQLTSGFITDTLFRCHFYGVDYIGKSLPTNTLNITGIAILDHAKYYISARNAADMTSVAIENLDPSEYAIYPNPTTGLVNLDIKNGQNYDVVIYSLSGQKILEKKNLNGHHEINLTGKSKGMYLINILTEKGLGQGKIVLK